MKRIMSTSGSVQDLEGSISLLERHRDCGISMATTVGVHPTRCMELEQDPSGLEKLLKLWHTNRDKICAVGEFGLDYDRLQFCRKDVQIKWFKKQFLLAKETKLPLFLHMRNACADFTRIIQEHRSEFGEGVVHSFTGNTEEAQAILEHNLWIGFNGCSLKAEETIEAIRAVPIDRIMVESDAPWCEVRKSHAGYRFVGTHFSVVAKEKYLPESSTDLVKSRNEPLASLQVLEAIAKIKEMDLEEAAHIIYNNSCRVFPF